MLPWGTSELTKQSLTEMSRDHHNGGGGLHFFLYLLLILLICSNPDSMHPKTQSIFSPAASAPFMGDWKSCRARRTIAVSIFFTGLLLLKLRIVLMFNHIRNWMKNTIMWVNTPVPSGKKLKKMPQQVDLLSKWEIGLRNEYIILGKSHNPHYCLIPCCARRAASIAVWGSTHQIWATKTNKLNIFLSDCEWELKI